jgi:hypothetical protein
MVSAERATTSPSTRMTLSVRTRSIRSKPGVVGEITSWVRP